MSSKDDGNRWTPLVTEEARRFLDGDTTAEEYLRACERQRAADKTSGSSQGRDASLRPRDENVPAAGTGARTVWHWLRAVSSPSYRDKDLGTRAAAVLRELMDEHGMTAAQAVAYVHARMRDNPPDLFMARMLRVKQGDALADDIADKYYRPLLKLDPSQWPDAASNVAP